MRFREITLRWNLYLYCSIILSGGGLPSFAQNNAISSPNRFGTFLELKQDLGFFNIDPFGNPITYRGGIAGLPFDIQPVVQIRGNASGYNFISVRIGNNPSFQTDLGCGAIVGQSNALIEFSDSSQLARFTNLGISNPGRGYTLQFCLGSCNLFNTTDDLVTDPFDILYGRLVVFSGIGSAEAGTAFSSQPRVLVESVVDGGTFQLATDYTYGVSAVCIQSSELQGQTTMWPALGLVQYTDLRMDKSSLQSSTGQYANFTIIFSSCYGVAEADCSQTIPMRVALNFTVAPAGPYGAVVTVQPNSTVADRPLGSVCQLLSWSRCKRTISVQPPTVAVVDQFGNPIDGIGVYTVCVSAWSYPGFNISVNATGTLQGPLIYGLASFPDVRIAKSSGQGQYALRFTISLLGTSEQVQGCGRSVFTTVGSDPFTISASEVTNLAVISLPSTMIAAEPTTGKVLSVGLTDVHGNIESGLWTQKESPIVNVEVSQYNGTGKYGHLITFCNPKCIQSDSISASAVDGVAQYTTFALNSVGSYILRFYSESLVVFSNAFEVVNAAAVRFSPETSPLNSPCWGPAVIRGSSVACRSGGYLRPKLSGPVFDTYDNVAVVGKYQFTVRISSSTTANIFCEGALFIDQAGSYCSVSSTQGVLQFTDLGVNQIALGLKLTIGLYGNDLSSPVVTPAFDAYALAAISVDSDPDVSTQAGCAIQPPPTVNLLGYSTTSSSNMSRISLSNIPVTVYIFSCNSTTAADLLFSISRLPTPALQLAFCPIQPQGVACTVLLKTDSGTQNSRPFYVMWQKPYYLYYCPASYSRGICAQSGFWRMSRIPPPQEGYCDYRIDPLQLQTCSSAASPDLISHESSWFVLNCTTGNQSNANATMCRTSAFFTPVVSPCNASGINGTTTVSTVDGKAVFNNIRLSIKGAVTLRFMVRLESEVVFYEDASFQISEASVGSISVIQNPTTGEIGIPQPIPSYLTVQVKDSFGDPVAGWQCFADTCINGGTMLTAVVFNATSAPSNASIVSKIPIVQSEIYATEEGNGTGIIALQVLTVQPGYFRVRLNVTYAPSCTYIPQITDSDHILDSTVFNIILIDVSKITIDSISESTGGHTIVINMQYLAVTAGSQVSILASLSDGAGKVVIAENDGYLRYADDSGISNASVVFGVCPQNDTECTRRQSSLPASFTTGSSQFAFTSTESGYARLIVWIPSLGLQSEVLSFQILPGHGSRLWITSEPSSIVNAGEFLAPGPSVAIFDEYGNKKPGTFVKNLTVVSKYSNEVLETLFGPINTYFGYSDYIFERLKILRGAPGCSPNEGIDLLISCAVAEDLQTFSFLSNTSNLRIQVLANTSAHNLGLLFLNTVENVTAMSSFSTNLQAIDANQNYVCSDMHFVILVQLCKVPENRDISNPQGGVCNLTQQQSYEKDGFVILQNLMSRQSGFFFLKISIPDSVAASAMSNTFYISSGIADSAVFMQTPLYGVAEEPLIFKSTQGNLATVLDVMIIDKASNILSFFCEVRIFLNCSTSMNTTELQALGKSSSNNGVISFHDLIPYFQDDLKDQLQCFLSLEANSTSAKNIIRSKSEYFRLRFISQIRFMYQPISAVVGGTFKNRTVTALLLDAYGQVVTESSRFVTISDWVGQEQKLLLCLKQNSSVITVNNSCTKVQAANGIAEFQDICITFAAQNHSLLINATSMITKLVVWSSKFIAKSSPGPYMTLKRPNATFIASVDAGLPTFIVALFNISSQLVKVGANIAQYTAETYRILDPLMYGNLSVFSNKSKFLLSCPSTVSLHSTNSFVSAHISIHLFSHDSPASCHFHPNLLSM